MARDVSPCSTTSSSPTCGPGVMLDNLQAHTVVGVAEALAAAGARLLSLPPSAPDCSPMEACWSKIKACLRAKAARTREAFAQAMAEAFETVTISDAPGWFRHAG